MKKMIMKKRNTPLGLKGKGKYTNSFFRNMLAQINQTRQFKQHLTIIKIKPKQ